MGTSIAHWAQRYISQVLQIPTKKTEYHAFTALGPIGLGFFSRNKDKIDYIT